MTIKHVIIPVDFSEVSIAAVDHGRWLADRSKSTVELVAVTTPRYARVTAAALTSLAGEQGLDAAFRVLETDNEDIEGKLVEAVLATPDTLWCVGSHGRTALGELLFGSVSADLVRDAEVPIAVVGPHAQVRNGAEVIAVALDGTPSSESVIPAAVTLAADLGLRLRLLQVGMGHVPPDAADTNYLARVARTYLPDLEHADYDTLYGEPGDELIGYVERNDDVAMLAMATRGIPAGARLSVPSTAMRVMRHAVVPVIMLHPREVESRSTSVSADEFVDLRKRVVVGIDTYTASKAAVDYAAEEAVRRDAVLQVVHTWHIPIGAASMYGYPVWPDIEACRTAALDEVSHTAHEIAAAHPELLIETIVAEGGAVQAIAEQSVGAELVVLGRHHHGRIAKMLLGSTSEAAAKRVECPLVIVPCDEPEPAPTT